MFKRTRLLAPDGNEGTLKAKESVPTTDSSPSEGISDALEFLDVPESLKSAVEAGEKKAPAIPATPPSPEAKAAAELAERAKTANRTPEAQAEFERQAAAGDGGKVEAPVKPAFSADEQAWLDLRVKATTEEEIAALEKDMPAFNEEQTAWINAQADAAETAPKAKDGETKTPEFSPEQKPFVDQLQADLAAAKTEAATQSKRAEELAAKVTQLEQSPQPVAGNFHPLLLTDNPADIDHYEKSVEEFIAWGRKNWDGSDAEPAAGDKAAVPAYSAAAIRERVTFYEQQLRKLVPAARQAQKDRSAQMTEAVKLYPGLADPKTGEAQIAAAVLKQWPMLRAMPNHLIIIGDAIRGEKTRLAEQAAKNGHAKPKPLRIAPKIAPRAGGAGPTRVSGKAAPDTSPDVKKFLENKATANDEIEALAKTLGD